MGTICSSLGPILGPNSKLTNDSYTPILRKGGTVDFLCIHTAHSFSFTKEDS